MANFLVFCTFDLKNASRQDYENAYADLQALKLFRVHKGTPSDAVIPTTSAMGNYTGVDAAAVAQHVREAVRAAFKARGLRSEVFVVAGENGSWASGTT